MIEIRHVEVMDMLCARDERLSRQNGFLQKYNAPLVSFTMNIAGSVKRDAEIERAFFEGKRRIIRQLERMQAQVLDYAETIGFTGCEALWAVDADAAALKARMIAVEEADELGRLFDIDVIAADGSHLSRGIERKCLICGGPVRACARSRAHSGEELFQKAHEIIEAFFREKFARRIGETAQRALLNEALTTPKPGLVDRENSGAHRDMDLFSFADSACTLRSYFEDCAGIGAEGADFMRLRYAGLEAEDKMFAAAKVNTHKGAIFSLGLLCCAAGFCGENADVQAVLEKAAELGKCALEEMKKANPEQTGGEKQFARYGLTGARGEAASGFANVTKIALPALERAMDAGKSLNDAGLCALLELMAHVCDSNIIRRAGLEKQEWVMRRAKQLLEKGFDHDDLRKLNDDFVEKNLSPGGCADLLAVAYFLYEMKKDRA